MTKPKKQVAERELLMELMKSNASINAHLHTLFAMECELFSHLTKSPVAPIIAKWSQFRMELMKQSLNDLKEQFKGRE